MITRLKKHTAISFGILIALTIAVSVGAVALHQQAIILPAVVLCVCYGIANWGSFAMRSMFTSPQSKAITSFYLADLGLRFFVSAMLIGVLIYLNKTIALAVAIISFVYFLVAMVLELSFFFAIERNNGIQNA